MSWKFIVCFVSSFIHFITEQTICIFLNLSFIWAGKWWVVLEVALKMEKKRGRNWNHWTWRAFAYMEIEVGSKTFHFICNIRKYCLGFINCLVFDLQAIQLTIVYNVEIKERMICKIKRNTFMLKSYWELLQLCGTLLCFAVEWMC